MILRYTRSCLRRPLLSKAAISSRQQLRRFLSKDSVGPETGNSVPGLELVQQQKQIVAQARVQQAMNGTNIMNSPEDRLIWVDMEVYQTIIFLNNGLF